MKQIIKITALIFFISLFSFAQTNEYLVAINLTQNTNLNNLEKLNLPIYFASDEVIITILDEDFLLDLRKANIRSKVLEKIIDNKYSIIQQKKSGEKLESLTNVDKVFIAKDFILTKNISVFFKENLLKNYLVTELKKSNLIFRNEKLLTNYSLTLNDSSIIAGIVTEINADSVRYFIQSLQNFQTRFLFANTKDAVAEWIKQQFIRMGYSDVKIDSFQYQGTWQKNVIATIPGTLNPNQVIVVGGHHDSYSSGDPMTFAPGADDNASGTTAALEIARVIKRKNYQPENTIKFVTFAAEEYGLWGSKDLSTKYYSNGTKVKLMINHDMISSDPRSLNQCVVDINYYTGSLEYRDLARNVTNKFTSISAVNGTANSSGSDSYSFWQNGFPSVYFEENQFSPYYHSPNDIITNYNMNYCAEVIKGSCATMLSAIFLPSRVENYSITDLGTGSSLLLKWSPVLDADLTGYKIFIGTTTGTYITTLTTIDTFKIISNLTTGTLYYVGVASYDASGNQSFIVERTGTPLSIPLQPNFTAEPQWHKVQLNWNRNKEFDLLGYNIYRSTNPDNNFQKLNPSVLLDTVYFDNNAQNGIYYWYRVKAVDSSMNESTSLTIKSRVVSLDKGILVVDETAEGEGLLANFTDAQVDDYYDYITSSFSHQTYDVVSQGGIGLADLGAFSTIIWFADDSYDLAAPFAAKTSIKKYLDYGGKLFYAGYLPSKAFEGNTNSVATFNPGTFVYDYLKIYQTETRFTSRFSGAISKFSGYNNLNCDSSKLLSSTGYHLTNIESITASSSGNEIYSFNSLFDSTSIYGNMKGKPVGVEYLGTNYKTVTVSFPLFFMKQNEAKQLVDNVVFNKFNETTSVDGENTTLPKDFYVEQNFPNPFNPSTKIVYNISKAANVKLKVFDILGNEIAILVNSLQQPGVYQVEFNPTEFKNNLNTSGIYFYQVQCDNQFITKKMVFLK